jgi:branched-chain amino acid transport system ATP-binding protein
VLVEVVHRLVAEGVAVLVVEQNLRAAVRLAHRQLVMVSGRIEAEFTGDELLDRPELQRRYLGVGSAAAVGVTTSQHNSRNNTGEDT